MQKGERGAMLAEENSRHFATPPLVSPRETTSEKRLLKCVTIQIWVVILIGRTVKEIYFSQSGAQPGLSSVSNFCNRFSDVIIISRRNQWWRPEMSAVCSGQGRACYLLVEIKNISLTFFCLTKKLFIFLCFFFWHRQETV